MIFKKLKDLVASALKRLHSPIYERRLRELVRQITPYLHEGDRVLDVGCGYGALGKEIMEAPSCPLSVNVTGLEKTRRGDELIPVESYDGSTFPYPDKAFDVVILADVLHHETDPHRLMEECKRVAKRFLIIKDHKVDGILAKQRIAFLDWAANMPFDVSCLYRYNTKEQWRQWHKRHGFTIENEMNSMKLYPPVVNLIFGGRCQYFVVLRCEGKKP